MPDWDDMVTQLEPSIRAFNFSRSRCKSLVRTPAIVCIDPQPRTRLSKTKIKGHPEFHTLYNKSIVEGRLAPAYWFVVATKVVPFPSEYQGMLGIGLWKPIEYRAIA